MEIICKDVPLGILTKDIWNFNTMEKIQYSNPNALAKIFVNNTVLQTQLTNKFIDNCPPKILNCLKIGITKFLLNFTKKGRPCKYVSDEERNEHKKEYDKKYYEQHKKSSVIVKA